LDDEEIQELDQLTAEALRPHQEAVLRLSEMPGFGPDASQPIIAEVGADASTFPSARAFSSWAGLCPGSQPSATHNQSSRSPKETALCAAS